MAEYVMLNGAIVHQDPLRLGQLTRLAEKIEIGGLTNANDIMNMVRRLLITSPELLAVVLTDDTGNHPEPGWLAEYMPAATLVEVVADFLICNRGLLDSITPVLQRNAPAPRTPVVD